MKIFSQKKIIVTIFLFILFYTLFVMYSDIEKIKENYTQITLTYLIPIFLLFTSSIFLRSTLQYFLLSKIGIKLSIKQSLLLFWSGLSMLITPGGSGQVIKSHFIQRMYGHDISKSLPLVFAERFYDFLALTIILAITMFLYYSIESLIITGVSSMILVIIIVAIKNTKFLQAVMNFLGKIPFVKKFLSQMLELNNSLTKLFEIKTVMKGCGIALLAFFLEGFVIYLGFLTFDVDLGYLHTIQIFYTSVLFGTLSFLPSGIGIQEATFAKLMGYQNLDLALIVSLMIFIRLTTTWYATLTGFILSYFTVFRKKSSH